MNDNDNNTLQQLMVCHHCDLVLQKPPSVPEHHRVFCPQCHHKLLSHKPNSLERTFIWTLTALVFFMPAIFLPLLHLDLFGQSPSSSVMSGILALWQQEFYSVAVVVLVTSVLAPMLQLILLSYVTYSLYFGHKLPGLVRVFKAYLELRHWGMLEIYLIGLLVSVIKLIDMAEVVVGIGLFSFIALLMAQIMAVFSMDAPLFWRLLEQNKATTKELPQ
ncbi:paraquat-inducible protein A [Pleionea sp. CnH1-48]|uniref:paraquat-inducible protein A n=1 Tax=Pleionea sp. CnH1-48 TaxID=2954494 RepID=UPI002096F551|nr:paraquat-inducible protein A [Pleionea sp. CnH1-48]MCO7223477.1 paraquat-inducible protein A [Pleionea sp. CnH1-48]